MLFKCPIIKVDGLLLNDKRIIIDNEDNSTFMQISLIQAPKELLKLSKLSGESTIGSVNFPLDHIINPKISSTQLEFDAKGPVDFKALEMNENLIYFNVKINFNSGYNVNAKAFSSFFDHWNSIKRKEKIISASMYTSRSSSRFNELNLNSPETTPKNADFIKRLPKVKKKEGTPFEKISLNNSSKKDENHAHGGLNSFSALVQDQSISEEKHLTDKIFDSKVEENQRLFISKGLTKYQETCWLKSGHILYGME